MNALGGKFIFLDRPKIVRGKRCEFYKHGSRTKFVISQGIKESIDDIIAFLSQIRCLECICLMNVTYKQMFWG